MFLQAIVICTFIVNSALREYKNTSFLRVLSSFSNTEKKKKTVREKSFLFLSEIKEFYTELKSVTIGQETLEKKGNINYLLIYINAPYHITKSCIYVTPY